MKENININRLNDLNPSTPDDPFGYGFAQKYMRQKLDGDRMKTIAVGCVVAGIPLCCLAGYVGWIITSHAK